MFKPAGKPGGFVTFTGILRTKPARADSELVESELMQPNAVFLKRTALGAIFRTVW
jgi:hypothetical protein